MARLSDSDEDGVVRNPNSKVTGNFADVARMSDNDDDHGKLPPPPRVLTKEEAAAEKIQNMKRVADAKKQLEELRTKKALEKAEAEKASGKIPN